VPAHFAEVLQGIHYIGNESVVVAHGGAPHFFQDMIGSVLALF